MYVCMYVCMSIGLDCIVLYGMYGMVWFGMVCNVCLYVCKYVCMYVCMYVCFVCFVCNVM